jgi:hypothetical protein
MIHFADTGMDSTGGIDRVFVSDEIDEDHGAPLPPPHATSAQLKTTVANLFIQRWMRNLNGLYVS